MYKIICNLEIANIMFALYSYKYFKVYSRVVFKLIKLEFERYKC